MRRRRGLFRPRYVAIGDTRDPMTRLLSGYVEGDQVFPQYDAQWKTIWKAQRIGFLDSDQKATKTGVEYVRK